MNTQEEQPLSAIIIEGTPEDRSFKNWNYELAITPIEDSKHGYEIVVEGRSPHKGSFTDVCDFLAREGHSGRNDDIELLASNLREVFFMVAQQAFEKAITLDDARSVTPFKAYIRKPGKKADTQETTHEEPVSVLA